MWIKGLPITASDILDRTFCVWSILPLSKDLQVFYLGRERIWSRVECAAKCTMNKPFLKISHLNTSWSASEKKLLLNEDSCGFFLLVCVFVLMNICSQQSISWLQYHTSTTKLEFFRYSTCFQQTILKAAKRTLSFQHILIGNGGLGGERVDSI